MHIDFVFILETFVVSFILTAYVSFVNFSQRKNLNQKLNEDCKEHLAFAHRHPYWNILITFSAFFLLTFLIKLLHDIIFT